MSQHPYEVQFVSTDQKTATLMQWHGKIVLVIVDSLESFMANQTKMARELLFDISTNHDARLQEVVPVLLLGAPSIDGRPDAPKLWDKLAEKITPTLKELGLEVYLDFGNKLTRSFVGEQTQEALQENSTWGIFGKDGTLLYAHMGPIDVAELRVIYATLLQAAGHDPATALPIEG